MYSHRIVVHMFFLTNLKTSIIRNKKFSVSIANQMFSFSLLLCVHKILVLLKKKKTRKTLHKYDEQINIDTQIFRSCRVCMFGLYIKQKYIQIPMRVNISVIERKKNKFRHQIYQHKVSRLLL